MKIEIKCRFTAKVLYAGEHESIKAAVEAAVSAYANLADANLADAYLAGAYLAGANLAGANLAYANLARANLARANLAYANLAYAYLAGANLARANLAYANLAGANLAGANIKGNISCSHELLAHVAVRFDATLKPVAAMICGRLVGCWREYTTTIRQWFGEDVMRRLWQAWSQDESWCVVEKMREHGWPEPVEVPSEAAQGIERDAVLANARANGLCGTGDENQ